SLREIYKMAQRENEIVIKATDRASGTIASIAGEFNKLQSSTTSFLTKALNPVNKALEITAKTALAGMGVATALATRQLSSAVSQSAQFEQAVADIGAVSNASSEELKQLSDLA